MNRSRWRRGLTGAGVGVLAAAASATLSAGCDTTCTLASCLDQIIIDLDREAWEPGLWRFEIETDGALQGACWIELPAESRQEIDCDDPRMALIIPLYENAPVGRPSVMFMFNGFNPDDIEDEERPTPESLAITISHEGEVVADAEYDLEYELNQPNGPGCSPTCYRATESIAP